MTKNKVDLAVLVKPYIHPLRKQRQRNEVDLLLDSLAPREQKKMKKKKKKVRAKNENQPISEEQDEKLIDILCRRPSRRQKIPILFISHL